MKSDFFSKIKFKCFDLHALEEHFLSTEVDLVFQMIHYYVKNDLLTLSPPSTTAVPYTNSLDLDEMPSNSASHPDPSCLTLSPHFHKTLDDIEALWKLKQTRSLADDNLLGGLRVNIIMFSSGIMTAVVTLTWIFERLIYVLASLMCCCFNIQPITTEIRLWTGSMQSDYTKNRV